MAKGNMLLGYARGKCGALVYSVLKGEQVTRPYNSSPSNPRTASQMYQRALFSDAVKFYTRGRRNLFQFAFEDKKKNESDYNAFMRSNARRGVVISKAAFDNYPYPAMGNFIMSKGTIPPTGAIIESSVDDARMALELTVTTDLTAVTTVANLTSLLVDGVEYLQNDILTFVAISFDPTVPNVDGSCQIDTTWLIKQVQLTNDAQPLSDYGITATLTAGSGNTKTLKVTTAERFSAQLGFAGVIIHSRNTSSKVFVSTEELSLNSAAEIAINAARERSYTDAVVESWRTTQQAPVVSEAVMQGSIAQSIALDFDPGE